jgi:hypothetical protein
MTRWFPTFLLALALALPARGQWGVDAPVEVPVEPGGTAEVDVTVTNDGPDANGRFLLRGFLPVMAGLLYQSVINSDPRVACALQGIFGGNQVFTCFCDPIAVPHGGKNTTKFRIGVSVSALPATKYLFGITYQYGNGSTIGRNVSIVVREAAAPQLAVMIERRELQAIGSNGAFKVEYDITVANTGTAPTTGPVEVDVSWTGPYGVSMAGQSMAWMSVASFVRFRISDTILPGAREPLPTLPLQSSDHVPRGQYQFTALAAGGGSPPAEAKDTFTPADLQPRLPGVKAIEGALEIIFGRPR